MAEIRGQFGPVTIANEKIAPGSVRKGPRRARNDPLNFIEIQCDIPKENKYDIGSLDVFNFGDELERLKITRYAEILKIEN